MIGDIRRTQVYFPNMASRSEPLAGWCQTFPFKAEDVGAMRYKMMILAKDLHDQLYETKG